MKVLFAVSNDEISESIVKRYQKEYKEIISYKNVYYFDAILKELQKDKTYDRVVISEDLEAFTSTQYDQIDKFIFEKLDSISDEASNAKGTDIPIILICSDRRTKSEQLLVKLFGIGIYDAIIGNDRSFEEVCRLINRPRLKKEAKNYYKIDSEDVNYQAENENDVSEMEIQNIVAHYKRLGKNEEKYVDSFNNIAAQYNDTQLRIITKFLPLNVRAVLEEKSTKYQQIMSFNNKVSDGLRYNAKKEENNGPSEILLTQAKKENNITEPIVIPSAVNMNGKKLYKNKNNATHANNVNSANNMYTNNANNINNMHTSNANNMQTENPNNIKNIKAENLGNAQTVNSNNINTENVNNMQTNTIQKSKQEDVLSQLTEIEQIIKTEENTMKEKQPEVVAKRGRGRPRKNPIQSEETVPTVKRGRGRPRKNPIPEQLQPLETTKQEVDVLPGLEQVQEDDNIFEEIIPGIGSTNKQQNNIEKDFSLDVSEKSDQPYENTIKIEQLQEEEFLPQFDNKQELKQEPFLPGFENVEEPQEEPILPGFENVEEPKEESFLPGFENVEEPKEEPILPGFDNVEEPKEEPFLPGFENVEEPEVEPILPGFENVEEPKVEPILPGFENVEEPKVEPILPGFENVEEPQEEPFLPGFENTEETNTKPIFEESNNQNEYQNTVGIESLLTPDKKIAAFVGTSKNGTSFIVNNIAEYISSIMGVKTAILDTTQNRNSYYIYTKNEDQLRNIATHSIEKLEQGIVQGINVNKNLTVFTSLPDENDNIIHVDKILETLVKNYSLILIDTDFYTPIEYFKQAQELYLVQSFDILTIQPLTAFLNKLLSKKVLDSQKLRIILNKVVKIREINEKTIIGGMSSYNEPAMTFMNELFDRETIKYISIPFDQEVYTKYLRGIIECDINLKGYSKQFMEILKNLTNMVYPLNTTVNNNSYTPPSIGNRAGDAFSQNMNSTLEQMRRQY